MLGDGGCQLLQQNLTTTLYVVLTAQYHEIVMKYLLCN